MKRKTDHIVYAVPDLDAAVEWFEEQTGVRPVFGGYHKTQGTKNAIVNLGNKCYLEILAIDEANTAIGSPRWMGIDMIEKPQITRWSLKSDKLNHDSKILKKYNTKMGNIQGGQRQTSTGNTLTWEMIMPLASPIVELIPFMTDWQHSTVHPTLNIIQKCELIALSCTHPNPSEIQDIFDKLDIDMTVAEGEKAMIHAKIKHPKGVIDI